jgi:hypothetical protein
MTGQAAGVAVDFSLSNIMIDLLVRLETSFLAPRQHELRCRKRTAAACSASRPLACQPFPAEMHEANSWYGTLISVNRRSLVIVLPMNGTLQVEVSDGPR